MYFHKEKLNENELEEWFFYHIGRLGKKGSAYGE
jgi:hypothetical protein